MEIVPARGGFEIRGDTFLVKDILKKHGAKWNGFAGAWAFTDEASARAGLEAALGELAFRQEMQELEALG